MSLKRNRKLGLTKRSHYFMAKKTKSKMKSKTKKKAAKKVAKKVAKKAKTAKKTVKKAVKKIAKTVAKKASSAKKVVHKAVSNFQESAPSTHPLLGSTAPQLSLPKQNGEVVALGDVIQSNPKVVLYFYPKDDTPGCTTEACGFRDNLNRLQSSGAVVLGVSPDSPESHQKFIEKYGLNFDLLSDENKSLSEALGVWKEKNFMGKSYMGVERSTFLFKDGKVSKVWQPVKVEGHVDDVLKNLS
jgi:peroxiredoxin Q/BCP